MSKLESKEASPRLSLIIPAYNEAKRLPRYLEKCVAYLEKTFPRRFEILVVDGMSTDRTRELAAKVLAERIADGRARFVGHPRPDSRGRPMRIHW